MQKDGMTWDLKGKSNPHDNTPINNTPMPFETVCNLTPSKYDTAYNMCSEQGVAFDSESGTLTFSNTVMFESSKRNPSDTMVINGTLRFAPF